MRNKYYYKKVNHAGKYVIGIKSELTICRMLGIKRKHGYKRRLQFIYISNKKYTKI